MSALPDGKNTWWWGQGERREQWKSPHEALPLCNIYFEPQSWSSNTLAIWCKRWLTGKDPDAGKDRRLEEKGTKEDVMVGWHHRLNGHEFEQTSGGGEGQGSLACYSPWGRRVGHDWATKQPPPEHHPGQECPGNSQDRPISPPSLSLPVSSPRQLSASSRPAGKISIALTMPMSIGQFPSWPFRSEFHHSSQLSILPY